MKAEVYYEIFGYGEQLYDIIYLYLPDLEAWLIDNSSLQNSGNLEQIFSGTPEEFIEYSNKFANGKIVKIGNF